jgi:hypothetical protein
MKNSSSSFLFTCIVATFANANESYLTANADIIILTTLLNVIMITLISAFRYQLSRNLRTTILPPQTVNSRFHANTD